MDDVGAGSVSSSLSQLNLNKNDDEKNFETFALIWCDLNATKAEDKLQIQVQLRKAMNYIKTFDNVKNCEHWLRCRQVTSSCEKFILIVSDNCGHEIIPQVYELPQLVAIYVFCINKENNENWNERYEKVQAVLTDASQLILLIKSNQYKLEKLDDVTSLPMSIYNISSAKENSSTGVNGNFLWFQLFIEVLLRIQHSAEDRQDLVELCKKTHVGNTSQIQLIDEFELTYSPSNALWWYTRESCLYKILNKALRCQDIDTFALHIDCISGISDGHSPSSITRAYRAQLMSSEELDRIRSSIGSYISMNSFLSCTLSREIALFIISSTSTQISNILEAVLFEIEIDPLLEGTKPHADISSESYFQNEKEVLFMLGSIFKIHSITETDNIWTVKLLLSSENDHQLNELSNYLKNKIEDEPVFLSLGNILSDMNEWQKASKYYQYQLQQLNDKNSYSAGRCYRGLGNIAYETGNYDLGIIYDEKALKIFLSLSNVDKAISICYNNLGLGFQHKKDYEKALEYYNKCLEIDKRICGPESIEVAISYNNIGYLYYNQEKIDNALVFYNRALEIREKYLPSDHYALARTYVNIGTVYHKQKEYEKALSCFQKSLDIFIKSRREMHIEMAVIYCNFGITYEATSKLELALDYLLKADQIYRYSLPSTHPNVIENQEHLETVNQKLKCKF
ncbi:unnamed protein product [Didymodactylos carnosus]|uniref:Uncharacterized protein n=1 Tax=Didymodactylos carnosus TaxID=1234261 RepID=A0A8S2DKT1_9BILA|nr:unnamed protein product [Didymodactylos carnosus]CAF3725405.1 unnamed protein product [Didymodactylos carnosus]